MKKEILIKLLIILTGSAICGLIVGVLFTVYFYGFIPRPWLARVYLSDTKAKMHFRFWAAFAVGAVAGSLWLYKIVKEYK